jgi:hypothetical protein
VQSARVIGRAASRLQVAIALVSNLHKRIIAYRSHGVRALISNLHKKTIAIAARDQASPMPNAML